MSVVKKRLTVSDGLRILIERNTITTGLRWTVTAAATVFWLTFPSSARAAEPAGETLSERSSSQIREEQYFTTIEHSVAAGNRARARQAAETNRWQFRAGGSLGSAYRYYKNIDNDAAGEDFLRWSFVQDLSFWYNVAYGKAHNFSSLLQASYVDRGVGATYTGIGTDFEGPAHRLAFYRINLEPDHGWPVQVTAGRQHLFAGRGVAYSGLSDGAKIEDRLGPFSQKHFVARSRPRENNLDYSLPGFDKEGDRVFWGTETAYTGWTGTTVYAFAVVQRDQSSENTDRPGQSFHYDSEYFGVGGVALPRDTIELWTEAVRQTGRSSTDATRTALRRTEIDAAALLTAIKYRPKWSLRPVFEAQYAYGSGDPDRTNVTNVLGGDTDGTDRNFLYFGYFLGGYALQPRLSNLHVTSLGASFTPLPDHRFFGNLALGVRGHLYRKDEAAGGTSDLESTENDAGIGQGWDAYLHWSLRKDLVASLRYGVFTPGDAFPEGLRDDTEYFGSSLTYSF